MLKYTGHPLVDVGVATITAFAKKSNPADITEDDLAQIADFIAAEYGKNPMRSFLTVIFPNSGFTQPAFFTQPAKRAAYADEVLRSWRQDVPPTDDRCVFYGTPAKRRVYRETLPLIGALSAFNFYPDGVSGLPISGEALLAIQAFPLGCLKCSGRVLMLHADDPALTLEFARNALKLNRRYLNLAAQADKYADTKHPRTQIITQLIKAEGIRRDSDQPPSITAYHLTNYGTNAAVDIFHLPLQIIDFLWSATEATYRQVWHQIVQRGWEHAPTGTGESTEHDEFGLPARRNVLFEDLFALPREAHRFLRTYLLRTPQIERFVKDNQRRSYGLARELNLVTWPLTRLFMEKVMNVEHERIETIRTIADRIADYIRTENDLRLFRLFLYGGSKGQDYQELRTRLIRADYASARSGEPLFSVDEFIATFENTDDRFWWLMARDLILIRMIERLHAQGWVAAHAAAINPPNDEDTEEEAG